MESLLLLALLIFFVIAAFFIGRFIEAQNWKSKVVGIRDDAVKRSRAVLTGKFSEQLAPYLPDFKYSPTEVRFVGKPIDFIVFKGMDAKEPEEVVFVEVKSGSSQLSTPERKLRDVIKEGKVSWELYRLERNK